MAPRWRCLRLAAASASLLALLARAQAPCDSSLLLSNAGLLPGQPLAVRTDVASDAQQCAFACVADAACLAYNFAPPSAAGCSLLPRCPFPSGCCWLKQANASSAEARLNADAACADACSFSVRAPPGSVPPLPPPPPPPPSPAPLRNVLYVLVDDFRPDALPWGASFMNTPNLARLAASATTFSHAYCNIAVCSPSRMSFLTGRYPSHTGVFNFIDHIRHAACPPVQVGVAFNVSAAFARLVVTDGGAGQCCSSCTADPACAAWTLAPGFNKSHGSSTCALFAAVPSAHSAVAGAFSGLRGTTDARDALVTLPQHFVNHGYLTLGTGKVFHTEEGGNGPFPWDAPGSGMPPLQDPPSWSRDNASMLNVNSQAPMRPCEATCSIPADAEGTPANLSTTFNFCDRIIGDDALLKLRRAAANREASGQPFFLAVGFRKPHLPFRHPSPYSALYPAPADMPLALHKTMDASIPPIAFHETSLAKDPYAPLPDLQAGTLRRDYYASISWMDHQLGRVLDELDALGLSNDTAVVFHADHGWSLGENGEWEK
jgi:arylsulfatase A-like enzyme